VTGTVPITEAPTVPETDWLAVDEVRIEPPMITTATELLTSVCTVPDTDWLAAAVPTVIMDAFVLASHATTEPEMFWVVGKFETETAPLTLWFAGGVKEAAMLPPMITVATLPRMSACTVPETDWFATPAPPTVITEAFVLISPTVAWRTLGFP
jgi:hypothetical protein